MPHIDQPIPKRRDHFGKGSLKQAILSSLSHLLIEQVYFSDTSAHFKALWEYMYMHQIYSVHFVGNQLELAYEIVC